MKFKTKGAQAARLLAEDRLSDKDICAQVGIAESTLNRWKSDEQFAALVHELVQVKSERLFNHHIARKARRIEDLQTLYDDVFRVKAARSLDPHYGKLPGGHTGLVATKYQGCARG